MATHTPKSLTDFLNKPREQFVVPIYQRDYTWEKENIDRLISDLQNFLKNEGAESTESQYFLGTVITQPHPPSTEEIKLIDIVDGQQRITTILIMLIMLHLMDEEANADLKAYYTVKGTQKLKIQRIKDEEVLEKVASGKEQFLPDVAKESRLYKACLLIRKRFTALAKEDQNFAAGMIDAIDRTIVFNVVLGDRADASTTYETINSAGVPLKDSDLIKNKIMSLSHRWDASKMMKLTKKYEEGIALNVEEGESDAFFRQFCAIKSQNHALPSLTRGKNKNQIYKSFKEITKNTNFQSEESVEELMTEMISIAEVWKVATEGMVHDLNNDEIFSIPANDHTKKALHDIVNWTRGTYFSLFAQLLTTADWRTNKGAVTDGMKVVTMLYVIDILTGRPEKKITRTVPRVFEEFKRQNAYDKRSVAGFMLWSKENLPGNMKIPSDDELKHWAKSTNHYQNKIAIKKILWLYEHILKSVQVDSSITEIEHVLPVVYTPWFKEHELTEVRRGRIEIAKNTIGNLTFLTKDENGRNSNHVFSEKLEILADNGYAMNKYFRKIKNWDEDAIDKRTEVIYRKLLDYLAV